MYLQPIPGLVVSHRYLFSYLKCEAWHITETWLIASTCSPIQNIRSSIYLLLVPIFLSKIWTHIYTWDLVSISQYNFRFFDCKNYRVRVAVGQVGCTYVICFAACKNYNPEAPIIVADQACHIYLFLLFWL